MIQNLSLFITLNGFIYITSNSDQFRHFNQFSHLTRDTN